MTIKLYDLFYGQPRTLLLLKGTPTLPTYTAYRYGRKIAFVARDVLFGGRGVGEVGRESESSIKHNVRTFLIGLR